MATQTKPNPITDGIETATQRVSEITEKVAANSKKAGGVFLDSYEKTVDALADAYVKAAHSTKIETITSLADAQADFAREATKSYTSAARTLVK